MNSPHQELAEKIKAHLALKDSSPGFHLSDEDLALISNSLLNQYGETLEIVTKRADDNGVSCRGFADALRCADPTNLALKMPWLQQPEAA